MRIFYLAAIILIVLLSGCGKEHPQPGLSCPQDRLSSFAQLWATVFKQLPRMPVPIRFVTPVRRETDSGAVSAPQVFYVWETTINTSLVQIPNSSRYDTKVYICDNKQESKFAGILDSRHPPCHQQTHRSSCTTSGSKSCARKARESCAAQRKVTTSR